MKLFAIAAAVLLVSCNTDTKMGKSGTTAADAESKEKVVLRLNYPAGFKQEVTYSMHTDVSGGGAVDEQVYLTYTAAPAADKGAPGYVFSGQVTRIKSASDVFGQKEAYDTADKNLVAADPELAADLGKLIGKDFTFSATNKGEILKKFAYKGLAQSDLDQPVALDNYFVKFPEEAVGVGQSWNAGFKNDLTGQQISNDYTLRA